MSNIIVYKQGIIIGRWLAKNGATGPRINFDASGMWLRKLNGTVIRNGTRSSTGDRRRLGLPSETKFKPAYLSALLGRGQARHSDIGAAKLGLFAAGVGVDIRYFYLRYERELPFRDWLLSTQRVESQTPEATPTTSLPSDSLSKLRAEFRAELAKQSRQQARELAALKSEVKRTKRS